MAYTMTASTMADKTAGPIRTCGFSLAFLFDFAAAGVGIITTVQTAP